MTASASGAPKPTSLRLVPRPALISVDRLSCFYVRTAAFRDVSLEVEEGRITAVIGPSGCGKTSFLSTLNRLTDLIPGCRLEGTIKLGDDDILHADYNTTALRRRVGMIFQKPVPFPMSIRKNLELPLIEHGVREKDEIDARVEQALRDVHLWPEVEHRLETSAARLSGGQMQRLCLARTLALRPEVLLLDEPCSALDPMSSGAVEDLIASLRDHYTVVIVTHNLAQARRLADRVAFFWYEDGCGRLVEEGAAAQIFEAPKDPLTIAYVGGMRG